MLPGPDIIQECPYCQAHARMCTLDSGNTFGSKVWSDGYAYSPQLPPAVVVTRCNRCRGIYWMEDAPVVGEVPRTTFTHVETTVKRRWWFGTRTDIKRTFTESPLKKLPLLTHLDVKGLREALAQLPPDHDPFRQRYLRGHLWWRFNDHYRQEPVKPPTKTEIALNQQNLATLIGLYDPQDPPAKFKCAAMLIGLERYGDAKAIAEMVEEEMWAPIRMKFIEAAEQRTCGIFRIEG